jgi:hypothetical protein
MWPPCWALDAAVSCAHECIQVLGGIGYTWEHQAHLYYRRAMSLRALLGPSADWAERVADLSLSGVRRPIQVELPGGDGPLRTRLAAELAEISALTGRDRAQRLADGGCLARGGAAPTHSSRWSSIRRCAQPG